MYHTVFGLKPRPLLTTLSKLYTYIAPVRQPYKWRRIGRVRGHVTLSRGVVNVAADGMKWLGVDNKPGGLVPDIMKSCISRNKT